MSEDTLSKTYDPAEVEPRWYQEWMRHGCFRAEETSDKPPFCIVLPPPNITGSLHIGHALTATIEDILVRWKRMSGYNVLWQPGTDHAGIATQMVVERELKQTEKKSRHDLGREQFVERVWEWKSRYGKRIQEQHYSLGASLDWSRERFTLDEGSSLAVKEVFVRLHEEGLIYRAAKLINWCPSCHTALSDLEVEHEERKGSLWHIRYPVKGTDRFLTVATTRPETLLGDTALAIHPDDERYAGLVGKTVLLPLVNREIPIIADAELVDMAFGTGVVKVTPAHDFNDYQTGLRHKLPMITILDENARINKEGGPEYLGLDRFEARKKILVDLEAAGLLAGEEPHTLSIGLCSRSNTIVEPRLSPQWFVKIEPLAKEAIQAVEQGRTTFVPESWTQVYFNWMRNIHDWCISRQLWWGHQIPAYYCTSCSPRLGDDTDLPLDSPTTRVGGIDHARATPVVSRTLPVHCAKCGGKSFEQDTDVLDTWFSSALWPFSTLGWPKETPALKTFYPGSVLETGHDIIFFWVSRMMMMGLHFMKDVPFKTVYLHAMVRDEKGEKMSKVKGNVIDPLLLIHGAEAKNLPAALKNKFPQGMPAFGADALRFTLAALTQQGRDIKLSLDRLGGYKAFANKLWNATRFVMMNLGTFEPDGKPVKERPLTLADRWILARLNRAVAATEKSLEEYAFADAANALYQFVWGELCDWYIELSKPALYGDDEVTKNAAREVLVYSLDIVLRLLHPFMPFVTEEIWQKLPIDREAQFLMLAQFPEVEIGLEDAEAEAEMAPVVAAIEGLRNIRGESNLSPAAKVPAQIQAADAKTRALLEKWQHYLIPLAGLSQVEIRAPGPKPSQAAAFVGAGMEIFVPLAGLMDLGEERSRLQKEIQRVDVDLSGILRKLENPNFVAKAPPDVVVKDRARVAELELRRSKLEDNLSRIAPEAGMSDPKKPAHAISEADGDPQDAKTASVKIAAEHEDGGVDLREELKAELENAQMPAVPDSTVREALDKLREGTKEGLTPSDHYDLGVAYMGMGLVDDAVREFNRAKEGGVDDPKAKKKKPGKKAKAPARKARPAAKGSSRGAVLKRAKPAAKKAKPAAKKAKPAAKKAKPKAKAKAPVRKAKPAAKKKKARR